MTEAKSTMDTVEFDHASPLDQVKTGCAKALFQQENHWAVKYDVVPNYQELLNKLTR